MNNWLSQQVVYNTEQWDKSMTTFFPESLLYMSKPEDYLNHLTQTCNYLKATEQLDWNKYLQKDYVIADIGCGGGWLSGYLSQFEQIKTIYAIDSSLNYVQNYLPTVISQMGGDYSKIEPVQALFSPVQLSDCSLDMIVISSAIHHAEHMQSVLSDFNRVLKRNKFLIILNETPSSGTRYLYQISRAFTKMVWHVLRKQYVPFAEKISAAGYLYDPYLGDVDYPMWYWKKAIASAGFELEKIVNTNLPTVKNTKGRSLVHLVCKKS